MGAARLATMMTGPAASTAPTISWSHSTMIAGVTTGVASGSADGQRGGGTRPCSPGARASPPPPPRPPHSPPSCWSVALRAAA
jgi:hypothetical protein